MPSVLSGWSAFIIYTLSYWILLLIGYALLLEIYLFHKSSHYLDDAVDLIATNPEQNKDKALEKIGNMIAELEAKRRSHFLLQNLDEDIDINLKPQQLAVHCCTKKQQIKPVKKVLTKLHIKLQKRIGEEKATKIMDDLFPVKNYS